MHLTSLESHHSVDLTKALSLVATAHGSATASTLDLSAMRKYHYVFCLSWPSLRVLSHRQSLEDTIARVFALVARSPEQQRESKRCADIQFSRNFWELQKTSPHLVEGEKAIF